MVYDLIIIGAGPAGISAAIYAQRGNLNTLIIEKGLVGGLVNNTNIVENYPGFTSITGPELVDNFRKHLESSGVKRIRKEVVKIEPGDIKKVITKDEEFLTKNIIIASGRQPRKTGLENEDKLYGRGISYCSLCDAPLYKGKNVAIYGGGNSAFEEGLYLAKYAKHVIILNRGKELRAESILQNKVKEAKNIMAINECKLTKINGAEYLQSIEVNNQETLNVEGLFIYIGYEPATKYLENLNITNEDGYISTNIKFETKSSGIYAVGDVNKKNIYQIVTAVAEGAIAAVDVIEKQ